MKLRNRDTNVEPSVQRVKRAATSKPVSPVIKRKKIKFDYDVKLLKNPNAVANFAPDIFKYMQSREPIYQLPACIKENISEEDRADFVNWIVNCQKSAEYSHETMYIAIRLFDIYVATHSSMDPEKFKLVAASSFWVASKFEEYSPVGITTLVNICQEKYEKSEFKSMEIDVLKTARYDLGFPLAYSFLRRYSRVIGTDLKTLTLARFYLEIATHYIGWSLESPSKMAAVSMVLALKKMDSKLDWEPILEHYSNHAMADLTDSVEKLANDVKNFKEEFPKCKTVISKYSDEAFFEVAKEFLD